MGYAFVPVGLQKFVPIIFGHIISKYISSVKLAYTVLPPITGIESRAVYHDRMVNYRNQGAPV